MLNAERAVSPRAQRGRPSAWAPTTVRDVLFRELYRGQIVWNRTRKRNSEGAQHQQARPTTDWIEVPAPELAIVTAAEWQAAHAQLSAARAAYEADTHGCRRRVKG